MSNKPLISIVVCTYNNADSLAITLDQLAGMSVVDPTSVEVILIDNNSPDNTKEIYETLNKSSDIAVHYYFEGRQGLSHARNTGLEKAQGEYILFTDDDAEIPENWVNGYFAQITECKPDCLYSKINIIWDKPIPWWYSGRYRPYFVGLDYGNKTLQVSDIHHEFFGKNFCIRKSLLVEFGGFDPALGRSGTRLIAGEETLIYRRLIESQCNVVYFPDSPVGHRLKEREYLAENIKKQFIDSSFSNYHIAKLTAKKRIANRPLGVLIYSALSIIQSLTLIPVNYVKNNKQELFFHTINTQRAYNLLKLWIVNK